MFAGEEDATRAVLLGICDGLVTEAVRTTPYDNLLGGVPVRALVSRSLSRARRTAVSPTVHLPNHRTPHAGSIGSAKHPSLDTI